MITAQEAFLETVFQKIARIIASRFDIKVTIAGGRAFVNMETHEITLPSASDEQSKKLAPYLDGFLDHEVAHVLFTDPSVIDKEKWTPTFHHIWNLVEDCYIERRMTLAYFGCGRNLKALDEHIRTENLSSYDTLGPFQKLTYALDACWRFCADGKDFHADPAIGEFMQLLRSEVDAGRYCNSSRECVEVAQRIFDKLVAVADGETITVFMPRDEHEKKPGAKMEAAGKEGEGTEAGEAAGGGDGEAKADDDKKKGEGTPKSGDVAVEVKPSTEQQDQAKSVIGAATKGESPKQDRESFVNDHIMKFLERKEGPEPTTYVVFSEDYDTERYFDSDERAGYTKLYSQLKDEAKKHVGNLSNILEQTLLARTDARWVGAELKGRRFDRQRLGRWLEGSSDERIFMRKEEGEKLDTAVSLLWDGSGSMGSSSAPSNKAALARLAAIAFHEALTRVNIAHEVLGFDTGGPGSPEVARLAEAAEARGENLWRYSRVEEQDNRYVFVPWGERDGRAICHLSGRHANRDGEAVLWASRRLAKRPETRKILIVGSDGQPSGSRYNYLEQTFLKDVVQRVISTGIEVYAIGIMDASVRSYYPNWVVIQNAAELPRAVMNQLMSSLTARGRQNGPGSFRGFTAT